MRVKKIFIVLGIVFLLAILYGIYKLSTFSLFDSDIKQVQEIRIPNKNYLLKIYYVPSNATTQSYIQVRKVENGKEEVIGSFERYNFVDTYKVINETTFMIVVRDTVSYLGNKSDTIFLKLK